MTIIHSFVELYISFDELKKGFDELKKGFDDNAGKQGFDRR